MDLAALFFSFKNSFVMFTKNDDNDSSFYRVTRKNCYFYMQLKKHEQIEKYAAKQEAKPD